MILFDFMTFCMIIGGIILSILATISLSFSLIDMLTRTKTYRILKCKIKGLIYVEDDIKFISFLVVLVLILFSDTCISSPFIL